jgi:hypothetical protein
MLPNSNQLAATGGRAVELLAQWDTLASGKARQ